MTPPRPALLAPGCGVVWAVGVLAVGRQVPVPLAMIQPALMGAFLGPGLVLAALLGGLALTGQQNAGRPLERLRDDTMAHLLLALCIWPLTGFFLGAGTVLTLGLAFVVARAVFWVGTYRSDTLALVGWWATFLPTLAAAALVLWRLLT